MVEEPIAEKPATLQWMRVRAAQVWHGVVDMVTPPLCLTCKAPVTMGTALCIECWKTLQFIDDPVCDVLGLPFAYDEGDGAVSPAAIADPPQWDRARAVVAFNDASKHLVHSLKYQDQQESGLAMARMMLGAGHTLLAETDVVVPVPLHRRRLWQRRFNQAAYLAQLIAHAKAIKWHANALLRVEATTSQVGLDAKERRKNVRRAFVVPPEKQPLIDGRSVLLIDDVRTTGATANACAATLKKAGAARVNVLSFALVLEPARLHIDA